MNARGHHVAGLCAGALSAHLFHGDPLIGAAVAQWTSLAPDIDSDNSTWGQHLPRWLHALIGPHRGWTHWPATCIAFGVVANALTIVAGQWLGVPIPFLAIAATAGVASHLLADFLTEEGLELIGPFSTRFYHLPRWLAVKGGGRGEAVMCGFIVGVTACLVYDTRPLTPAFLRLTHLVLRV